ncbi:MAG: hypothetical protein PHT31_05435 [Candidatus Omnitrophica bacterium]|nr:hypothetical protein [Candidatus Omnitrophota bacterium]MDD5653582.1 hypothetical protein [Candidatus Omnitrophota bacterium]
MIAKLKNNNKGIMLSEYVMLVGVIIAGLIIVSEYIERTIKGKIVYMSDNYLGAEQETRDFPYNLSGGKQFVDQSGVYNISGDTSIHKTMNISQDEHADGSRDLKVSVNEQKQSPGIDELQMKALPDYRYPEVERKAFVPKFVRASEGYVDPPAMPSGSSGGGSGGGSSGGGS